MKLLLPIALDLSPRGKNQTLLICRLDLGKLKEEGKQSRWKKPKNCPVCGSKRLWGHGFVLRNFVGFALGLWMKRWRCPDCRAVHCTRPEDYHPGMQYPIQIQKETIEAKLARRTFLKTVPRQIQQHWWKAFLFCCRHSGNWTDPLSFFQQSIKNDYFPVTIRRVYREIWLSGSAPYLPFAVTVKSRPFNLD